MKRNFGFISNQIGLGQAEKEEKKKSFRVPFSLDLGYSIPKKNSKKTK